MSQYMPKGLPVDAVRVEFGSGPQSVVKLPGWLRDRLLAESEPREGDDLGGQQEVTDGSFVVHHGGGVIDVMPADTFHAKYKAVRNRKGAENGD